MIQFRLFGIPISIQPLFWLTLAILGGALSGVATKAELLNLGLFVLAGFVSILIHELGHAFMVRFYKLPTEIVLQAFGGYATHPAGVLTRGQSFLVTAAGPAIQLLLGAGALAVLMFAPLPDAPILYFVWALMLVSFAWAILNCFPIYPLDGGRMLESVLGPRRQKALFLTGLITAGTLSFVALAFGAFFMAVFMALFAWENYKFLQASSQSRF